MPKPIHRRKAVLSLVLGVAASLPLASCRSAKADVQPSIEFTRVPTAGEGSPTVLESIEGRVRGAQPGQRIVLFALSGIWWVQPLVMNPFTTIQSDSRWKNVTHPGLAYGALLVDSRYRPPLTVNALPEKGGSVLAVATVEGRPSGLSSKMLQFSGYQWELLSTTTDRAGSSSLHSSANAWTDKRGSLHLRITREQDHWTSAEVKLSRSLGYGSYRFVVQDVSHLEPAAVFAMFTWDESGPPREMDIEISRWGEPEDKNAQFVIQPYVVPANTVRFIAPPGTLTYWINWSPGRVAFKTVRGTSSNVGMPAVAEHVFTSGIPSPGNERIRMNLYAFENKHNPLQHEDEVVLEKFEYLP